MSSPLKRAVHTAALAFEPALKRPEVSLLLVPLAQEISAKPCDIGYPQTELKEQLAELLGSERHGIDIASKIDLSLVEDGWNLKQGIFAPKLATLQERTARLRNWLFARPEKSIALVTHGAFLHYLTEDWSTYDRVRGTGYQNCEFRAFRFTPASNEHDAHLEQVEGALPRQRRPTGVDASVLGEI